MNDDLQHNIKFWFVLEHYGDYEIILYSNGEMLEKLVSTEGQRKVEISQIIRFVSRRQENGIR